MARTKHLQGIALLREKSFPWIIDALDDLELIYEYETSDNEIGVMYIKNDESEVEVCLFGAMCYKRGCPLHHFHYDITNVDQNYQDRQPEFCRNMIYSMNHYYSKHLDEYQDFVDFCIQCFDAERFEQGTCDINPVDGIEFDNEIPDYMMGDMIDNAVDTKNYDLLDNLKSNGYRVSY